MTNEDSSEARKSAGPRVSLNCSTGAERSFVSPVSVHVPATYHPAALTLRYLKTLTEIGVENLARRLVEVAEDDKQFGECDVNFFPNAKVNGRICTCVQVSHPVPRRNFRFHLARVFIDDELMIPIRFEAYDWPNEEGGQPKLLEEYTYMNVKVNNGFTDADFDPKNETYKFNAK